MDEFNPTRLVYEDSDPSDVWTVTGIGHSKIRMENVSIMDVATIEEYESGCQIHEKCMGHICRSPYGMILPMQSLVVSTPVVRNDIYKAARAAFEGPGQYYKAQHHSILADSMKKKTGRMRKGILNCHIDGSLRMVITPLETDSFDTIAIPHYLKDKWSVPYFDSSTNRYKTRYVQDGDNAIVLRPPPLSIKSVQKGKVTFWNQTCVGIPPDILKAYDGDYDGDEIHIYPVYSEGAIDECKKWTLTPNEAFIKARDIYNNSKIPNKGSESYSFMDHTTVSFEEIRNGIKQPLMAEQTRTKLEHLIDFRERYNIDAVSKSFVAESIRGMADTNSQQLSQSTIGDMSRIAKLAASCVIHRTDSVIGIATKTDFEPVCTFKLDLQDGNSCMRAMSTICANIQQIALEAHHAKKRALPSHDMITNLILGEGETLLILDSILSESQIRSSLKPLWYDRTDNTTYVLCEPSSRLRSFPKSHILGSYNPVVLSMISETRALSVCTLGLSKLVRYYSLALSETEIMCLAVLFSYRPNASKCPIATRDGMMARDLRWTEVTMANHYTGLSKDVNKKDIDFAPIDTASACLMTGNFRQV